VDSFIYGDSIITHKMKKFVIVLISVSLLITVTLLLVGPRGATKTSATIQLSALPELLSAANMSATASVLPFPAPSRGA
jgi:hypothetical protein